MLWHFGNSKIESWKGCKRTTVKLYARLLVLCPLDITEDFRIYLFYCEKVRKTEFIPKLREFAAYLRNEVPNYNLCNTGFALHNYCKFWQTFTKTPKQIKGDQLS